MMDEKINDGEKNSIDDFMLPGFRFHPTDEELVGFYLRRKLQQRSLPIELIKQVDIYKYDPWDLPKLASTGEKEWYFYCPRDRKYRNSTRPNRVTGSGFWKATGTDRPIYSSDIGTKCIGLKKSLVFYRGRAAKGLKTDWMMHEFRLPSATDGGAPPPKKTLDKNFPATDSWAICRIFKKTNSMANRQIPWQIPTTSVPELAFTYNTPHHHHHHTHFNSPVSVENFSALNPPTYKTLASNVVDYFPGNFVFSPSDKNTTDFTSVLFSPSSSDFEGVQSQQQQFNNGFSSDSSLTQLMMQENVNHDEIEGGINLMRKNSTNTTTSGTHIIESHNIPFMNIRSSSMGFPFSLQQQQPISDNSWKPNTLPWDSPSPTCPSEMSSTNYSTNKSHT